MSKCSLQIILDEPDLVYKAGDIITGHITVNTPKSVVCRALALDFGWRTRSDNPDAAEQIAQHVLFEGMRQPEQRSSYPFSLEVPNGPFTYHGKHFEVQWTLTAKAKLQQARNAKTEIVISVVPGPCEAAVNHGPYHPLDAAQENTHNAHLLVLYGIGALAMSLAIAYALVYKVEGHTWALVLGWLFVVAVGLGGLFVLYLAVRSKLAEQKLGPVSVDLSPTIVAPGDTISCTVRFTPRVDLHVDDVEMWLVGEESLNPKDNAETNLNYPSPTHTLHEERQSFSKAQRLRAGHEWKQTTRFVLPDDAPFTFNADTHSVTWTLRVHISIPQWPDWTYFHQITLVPHCTVAASVPMHS